MATKLKSENRCDDCKKEFDINLLTKIGTKKRCPSCQKEIENLNRLKDYIWLLQGKDKVKIIIATKLIQAYKKEYGFTYQGIYLTLKYFVEVEQGDISNGIGIVPHLYTKARAYEQKKYSLKKHTLAFEKPLTTYKIIKPCKEEYNPQLNLPNIRVEDIAL